ncbi:Endoribonuclease Nob1 [uncultured archaeon]|nr:Endoribonuclease Nob1 [uncultured archaeon]
MVREKSKYYNFQEPLHVYVVADASVFIWGKRPEGELITVPSVEAELRDIRSKSLLHIFEARVESPSSQAVKRAHTAARETGDIAVLSPADLEVLAKALEYDAVLATDDYALQNVALHLGLKIEPIGQAKIKRLRRRVQRCQGCGKSFEGEACPDCGTPARKKKRCIR